MIISHEHRFVFVHIHKTAGEAVTLALLPRMGRGLALGGTTWGNVKNLWYSRAKGVSKHSDAAEIRAFTGPETWERYFTFAFVRHPFDRALSFYSYLGQMSDRREGPGVRNFLYGMPFFNRGDPRGWPGVQAYREAEDFSAFIRHPKFVADPGSNAQADILCDGEGRILVDFVGHFERLNDDFAEVARRIGMPDLKLPMHNASVRSRARTMAAADQELLREFYARDFEAFGFDTAGWELP
ncbi:sulfotransferase family 2 domain-containing protein [Amaricoccus tamworthensis]|uniref:sulfotransferase family 2 domain-containing protein n=1 Tax=Amaricoccus tamworthensis TaxID=57002 RepID=UPI003C7B0A75